MLTKVDKAYGIFNLLVRTDSSSIEAGFQEIVGLTAEMTRKTVDVTLRHGIIGTANFQSWINGERGRKNIKIELRDESRSKVIKTWTLINARPIKYTGPTLNAKGGSDVTTEELVLTCERLDLS